MKTSLIILILFFFIMSTCLSQVTTTPVSIGIGPGTVASVPFHINTSGEAARFQGTSPYVSLYDGILMNGYIQAINNTFEIGSKNNYDINFYTGDTPRMNINGTSGVVTVNQQLIAQSGIKLTGPLQAANDLTGSPGMVLVSKGNATPAWEERGIGFAAYMSNTKLMNSGTAYVIDGLTEHFDDGFNFNPTTGEFTVPITGLYQFNVNPLFLFNTNLSNAQVIVGLYNHGTLMYQYYHFVGFSAVSYTSTTSMFTTKLTAGDVITFKVTQNTGYDQTLLNFSSTITISGYKIF
ncbi:C1q-like domain-containing protein [Emticicia soli]